MVLSLKHLKESEKSDGEDESLLQPSDWNAEHKFEIAAKKLVGNSVNSPGNVEELAVGTGLKLEDGALTVPVFSGGKIVTSSADVSIPTARVLTNTASVTWDAATANQIKANVAAITPVMLEKGNPGDIIAYGTGTTGNAVASRLAAGSPGSVLVTGSASVPAGVGAAPSWAFSGAPHAVLRDEKPNNTNGGDFDTGQWRDRVLNQEVYDTYEFVTLTAATTTNISFTLVAGTYVIEWSAPAYRVNRHQTRLINITDNIVAGYGTSEFSATGGNSQTRSTGVVNVTVAASKVLKIQHRCEADSDVNSNFGVAASLESATPPTPVEVYTVVKIWRVA